MGRRRSWESRLKAQRKAAVDRKMEGRGYKPAAGFPAGAMLRRVAVPKDISASVIERIHAALPQHGILESVEDGLAESQLGPEAAGYVFILLNPPVDRERALPLMDMVAEAFDKLGVEKDKPPYFDVRW